MILRKRLMVQPTKIASMIIIWYLIAIDGGLPPNICPVIIPGSVINPITDMVAINGFNPCFTAILTESMLEACAS